LRDQAEKRFTVSEAAAQLRQCRMQAFAFGEGVSGVMSGGCNIASARGHIRKGRKPRKVRWLESGFAGSIRVFPQPGAKRLFAWRCSFR
jgi:hypothetical protein